MRELTYGDKEVMEFLSKILIGQVLEYRFQQVQFQEVLLDLRLDY